MKPSYKSLLDQVSEDIDAETWLEMFDRCAEIYVFGDSERKDFKEFFDALMALPVADLLVLNETQMVKDWSGLHRNPMLMLWVEAQDEFLISMCIKELWAKTESILLNPANFEKKRPPGESGKLNKRMFLKEGAKKGHDRFMAEMRGQPGWSNFVIPIIQEDFFRESYVYGISKLLGESVRITKGGLVTNSKLTLHGAITLTKIVRILAKSYNVPPPKTILSFLAEDDA